MTAGTYRRATVIGIGAIVFSTLALASLPREIILTGQDVEDINQRHVLRERPIGDRLHTWWDARISSFPDLPVLSGDRDAIIGWFRNGQPGLDGMRGFQNRVSMRVFQYDMLCAELLSSGDAGILAAVLECARPLGRYALPELDAIVRDESAPLTNRIIAWARHYRAASPGLTVDEATRRFRDLFGETLDTEHILAVEHSYAAFPFWVFTQAGEKLDVDSRRRLSAMLVRLLDLRHLARDDGRMVCDALRALGAIVEGGDSVVARIAMDHLVEWDARHEELSMALWRGMPPASSFDAVSSRMLRDLSTDAHFATNASSAFYMYPRTPAGIAEVMEPDNGWQLHFDRYLAASFSRPDEREQIERLAALTRQVHARPGVTVRSHLVQWLGRGKVRFRLGERRAHLLARAWHDLPRALEIALPESRTGQSREPRQEPF